MGKYSSPASVSPGSRDSVAPASITKGIYCIHDNVSGENGPPVFCVSDEAFVRDFGIAFSRYDVPPSLAVQWCGVKLGDLLVPNNPHSLPRIVGYECPVPICSAAEAMNMYHDFTPKESLKEASDNG